MRIDSPCDSDRHGLRPCRVFAELAERDAVIAALSAKYEAACWLIAGAAQRHCDDVELSRFVANHQTTAKPVEMVGD